MLINRMYSYSNMYICNAIKVEIVERIMYHVYV